MSSTFRLLQIEGALFRDNVVAIFTKEGVPEEQVEEALVWAVGDDFYRMRLKYWPKRIRERLQIDFDDASTYAGGFKIIAQAWRDRNENTKTD